MWSASTKSHFHSKTGASETLEVRKFNYYKCKKFSSESERIDQIELSEWILGTFLVSKTKL